MSRGYTVTMRDKIQLSTTRAFARVDVIRRGYANGYTTESKRLKVSKNKVPKEAKSFSK